MCTPEQANKIRAEVGQWIQRGKMFTSVDIANSLKQRGDWIRNREVADYLRNSVVGMSPQYGSQYEKSIIDVQLPNGSYTEATLYHPKGADKSSYTKTNQKAMSPDEAKKDDPFKVVVNQDGVSFVPPAADEEGDHGDCCHSHSLLQGVSAARIAEFEPRPYQVVTINIGQVGTLIIGRGSGPDENIMDQAFDEDYDEEGD